MKRQEEIVELVIRLQELARAEWGDEYLDCDCGHEPAKDACDCYMCTKGWRLTEYLEIHSWEEKLIPLLTSRTPRTPRVNPFS